MAGLQGADEGDHPWASGVCHLGSTLFVQTTVSFSCQSAARFQSALGAVEARGLGIHRFLHRGAHEQPLETGQLRIQGEGDLGGIAAPGTCTRPGAHRPGNSPESNMAVRFQGGHLDVRRDSAPCRPVHTLVVPSPSAQLALTLDFISPGPPMRIVLGVGAQTWGACGS